MTRCPVRYNIMPLKGKGYLFIYRHLHVAQFEWGQLKGTGYFFIKALMGAFKMGNDQSELHSVFVFLY